jgi:hypothetical protein
VPVGRYAGALERAVERHPRADEKGDQVVAPQVADVGHVAAPAVLVHRIFREIGAQVRARRELLRLGTARIAHLQHRAGARVPLAIEQELERVLARHDGEIAHHVAVREAARAAGMALLADIEARLLRRRQSITS